MRGCQPIVPPEPFPYDRRLQSVSDLARHAGLVGREARRETRMPAERVLREWDRKRQRRAPLARRRGGKGGRDTGNLGGRCPGDKTPFRERSHNFAFQLAGRCLEIAVALQKYV